MTHTRAVLAPPPDPVLAAATAAARDTFRYFWRELNWEYRREDSELGMAGVLAAVPEGDVVEHLWLELREFDGRELCGEVVMEPDRLTSVGPGSRVHVEPGEIEDWLLVLSGTVYGGFTIQAHRAALGWRERRRHDRAWGLPFDKPPTVRTLPQEVEHPASIAAAESLRADPDAVLPDDGDFSALHLEAWRGNGALVELLLERGADRDRRTPRGDTALDVARRMGWTHVVEILER